MISPISGTALLDKTALLDDSLRHFPSQAADTPEIRELRAGLPSLGWPMTLIQKHASLEEARLALVTVAGIDLPPVQDLAAPAWVLSSVPWLGLPEETACMMSRPPVWIRLQTEDTTPVSSEFANLGVDWQPSVVLPGAWRVNAGRVDLSGTTAFKAGLFEVQDLGSQAILAAVDVAPGGRWRDACAGAGGKTLQLARLLGPGGRVDAQDLRPETLRELRARFARARSFLGATVSTLEADATQGGGAGLYDGVLCDAPCTGSGTWRRSPHLRWQLKQDAVSSASQLQLRILRAQARHVRVGGHLVYATCSILPDENSAVIRAFLALPGSQEFELAPIARDFGMLDDAGLTIRPSLEDNDSFFVSRMKRCR